ncbi:MAG: BREX-2 system adenine-specific DNA-methyltransferase PglX, partial [Deltaproteobacteria bacterium]|nr:BREX-2 system adenine-specific DNA-methyltransferase PglX [Deltaproteobacteria bacterium]
DRTLEPAIATFGIDAVRVIDPTCGSGHFLLGAFHRLLAHLERARPGADRRELAAEALAKVYGSDVNPYAVAIARFRLLLAFVEVCGVGALADAPALPSLASNVVVADSLLLGAEGSREMMELAWTGEDQAKWGPRAFDFADPVAVNKVFRQRFHAVVGNPPYIVCRDSALSERYREGYPDSAQRQFALAAPFTERFFKLALDDGFVGLINANSFMKREFGRGLVEKVLPRLDLNEVIDTSGAFIPGHGTPTVILFGRHRRPEEEKVRVVMGRRGEPETPAAPARGKVWSSIATNIENLGFENEYVTIADVARATLAKHPWSLGGGGADDLKARIESECILRLSDISVGVGRAVTIGDDDVYSHEKGHGARHGLAVRTMLGGDVIRDWSASPSNELVFPFDGELQPSLDTATLRFMWPHRAGLENRVVSASVTMKQSGRKWFDLRRLSRDKLLPKYCIAFPRVATHNHFILRANGVMFKDSAPVITLGLECTENDHLALLAWINSSAACFWLKTMCQNKGAGAHRTLRMEEFEQFFEFNGANVEEMPIPAFLAETTAMAGCLCRDALHRATFIPVEFLARFDASRDGGVRSYLASGADRLGTLLAQMVARQEELDWHWYVVLGLLEPDELARHRADVARVTASQSNPLSLAPGHRAFEQVLDASGETTSWFERNGYERPTEAALARYSEAERALFATRRWIIANNRAIALIERPEYKRRWTLRDYDAEAREAAAALLLDRVEAHVRSAESPMDVRTLVHALL